jgi:hypothetical protein
MPRVKRNRKPLRLSHLKAFWLRCYKAPQGGDGQIKTVQSRLPNERGGRCFRLAFVRFDIKYQELSSPFPLAKTRNLWRVPTREGVDRLMIRTRTLLVLVSLVVLFAAAHSAAQLTMSGGERAVPRLLRFGGTIAGARGSVTITFAMYRDQTGGAPLWLETQVVDVDARGHYAALLGAAHAHGVPVELFASGDARWLGIQPEGEGEQPRVLLVSVPYALKAADAEALGGRPASAYALASTEPSAALPLGRNSAPAFTVPALDPAGLTRAGAYRRSVVYQADAVAALPAGPEPAVVMIDSSDSLPTERMYKWQSTDSAYHVWRQQVQTDGAWQLAYAAAANGIGGAETYDPKLHITSAGNFGIGTTAPEQKLSVAGVVESTSGGFKFPDATTQTTAAMAGVSTNGTLSGAGTPASPLAVLYGSSAGTAAQGNDPRLSDARVPLPGSSDYIQNSPATAQTGSVNVIGSVTAGSFTGNGAGLTNVPATALPWNVVLLDNSGRIPGYEMPTTFVGNVQLAASSSTCAAQLAGLLRWTGSQIEVCNGTLWKPIAPNVPPALLRPNTRRSALLMANGSTAALAGFGDALPSSPTPTALPATLTDPPAIRITTDAWFAAALTGNYNYVGGRHLLFQTFIRPDINYAALNEVIRAGFSDSASSNGGFDCLNSTGNCASFYTASGKWYCAVHSSSAGYASANSGLALSASWFKLEIYLDDSSGATTFSINGTAVCALAKLPDSSSLMRYHVAALPSGSAVNLDLAWIYLESD